ncbi:MAG: thiamine diphosphokinase [Mycoplasmatales bacterium]
MNILLVLGGKCDLELKTLINDLEIKKVIAVDGGVTALLNEKLTYDFLIGDGDSANFSLLEKEKIDKTKIIKLNPIKDETDFEVALNVCRKEFGKQINKMYIVGFASLNRLDHLLANIKQIKSDMIFLNKYCRISCLNPGKTMLKSSYQFFSMFAIQNVSGLNLSGFKYQLDNYNLQVNDSLCISNELLENKVGIIEFTDGKLLLIETNE